MTPHADINTMLLCLLFPILGIVILAVKKRHLWEDHLAKIRKLPRLQQVALFVVLGYAVAMGSSKPGPTLSNLKILIAERASKRLSSGQEYGEKAVVVDAGVIAQEAQTGIDAVTNALPVVTGTIDDADDAVTAVEDAPRYYLRQRYQRPLLSETNNLYSEIALQTVDTNGVCMAYVWFSVTPNVQPDMRFIFAAKNIENVKKIVSSYECSFPDTFTINGYECILYAFKVPDYLMKNGKLSTPIDYEREVTCGCEASGEPFDIRGGILLDVDGDLYTGVTGYVTNSITGQVLYFNDGFTANPPMNAQNSETPLNEEM